MMTCRTKLAQALPALLFVTMILLEIVEGGQKQAKPRRRRIKKSRAGKGKDFSEFLLVIGAIMTCVIAPVFAFFLHSIYKDPAAPELAWACWKAIKGKLLSYLGGQQPAMPDSSVDRNNTPDSSSALRASRRREINTIDNRNEATDQGTASRSTLPPTIGTATTDRLRHSRRYAEDDDRTEDSPRNRNVSFVRRNYHQEKKLSERRPDPATMAPHSSGALFPPWGGSRGGASIRAGASHEAAGSPKPWRAGFRGDKEMVWDPYPDTRYDDDDDDEQDRGVYKSARSKRRMSRNKRARAAKGSSLGEKRGSVSGLDGGGARDSTTRGRTSGFS